MPQTDVIFYQEAPGNVPVLDWIEELAAQDQRAGRKCLAAIQRLKSMGHELRRPEADLLRDGVYELRVGVGRVNYRLLYFFHGRNVAILAHGLTKEKRVPPVDIDRAVARKKRFEGNPETHSYRED